MNNKHVKVCIMAGGVGSRFWPKSRNSFPKQFIDILGTGSSLLQLTYNRFRKLVEVENIFIVTNDDYSELVLQQLPELTSKNLICEPSRNNTAPCIAYTAFKLYNQDPDALMVVVPSDHLILKESEYLVIIEKATEFATKEESLVTLGIKPTRPDSGYGYIQYDSKENLEFYPVTSFREKPDKETAQQYLESGNFLWNAGMFIWRTSTVIEALKRHSPDIYEIFNRGVSYYNTDSEKVFIDKNYPACPNISIDFALMEKATNVFTIPADIGWSDLGTWNSLYEVCEKDDNENALIGVTNSDLSSTTSCIINVDSNKLVVINGLNDFIVVDNDNALLIYPREQEQSIKAITNSIKEKGMVDFL